MTVAGILSNKISRIAVAVATVVTAAILALGGLAPVGAQAAGTYDCGTYGAADYDATDCSDPTTPTGGGTTTTSGGTISNSGSGSGTTNSTSTTPTSTILLNDFSEYTSSTGKTLTFKTGDVFHFNLGTEQHTITVKSFDKNDLVVTIASTPTDVTVPLGQTVNYDVDQDGTADIAITYTTLANDSSTATAIYRALSKEASTTTTTPPSTGSGSNTSTGGSTGSTQHSTNLWWVWIIPVVLGVGLLIWAIVIARKRRAAANGINNNGGGTTFNQF